ncbi:MAG: phenylacetate--CoA ligase [Bacteroidales bacterium]|nr:phenylacetate--CoA ligase [Bacteroidales bacterium]
MDRFGLFQDVRKTVPGYEKFLSEHGITEVKDWEDIPFCDKQNYLLTYPIRELIRENTFNKCFLIGASSGFSKSGSVLWLKQSEDEEAYIEAVKQLLIDDYSIDKKSTLIIVSLALGTWIGGMQLACAFRSLAGKMDGIVTTTPGIDLKESAHIAKDFGPMLEQIVWVTNPSSISIIYSLLRDEKELLNGKIYFPVVGEYFTENFRISVAKKFGHDPDNVYVAKTGYGSADTGDLGIESRGTILLRKFLNNNPKISAHLFHDENPPMLFEKNEHAYLETVDEHLIVTKDQFVPLIRYNTKDTGGIIKKETLKQAGVKESVLKELPEELLYVFGRTSDAVVFYGTNLNIYSSGDFLNSLDKSYCYGGLYEVQKTEKNEVEFLDFTVFVIEEKEGLARKYQEALIGFLKASSNEFNAKYDRLSAAASDDLVQVKVEPISHKNLATKHHTIRS